eukprot:TRINITY_DN102751_c0_g1_i1.p1 TRINITY_DN102751_c0_g1~~TRINITY_DN102751_c0_g1_i1.p1  ORF type:complete len:474 (-),score=78.66 TRINITY_DN102751_c0_g1_i1:258-1679(-)
MVYLDDAACDATMVACPRLGPRAGGGTVAVPGGEPPALKPDKKVHRSKIDAVCACLANCKDPICGLQRKFSDLSTEIEQEAAMEHILSERARVTERANPDSDAGVTTGHDSGEDVLEENQAKLTTYAGGRHSSESTIDTLDASKDSLESTFDTLDDSRDCLESTFDTLDDSKNLLGCHQEAARTQLHTTTERPADGVMPTVQERLTSAAQFQFYPKRQQLECFPEERSKARISTRSRIARAMRRAQKGCMDASRLQVRRQAAQPATHYTSFADSIAALLPLPTMDIWQNNRLAVNFERQDNRASYDLVAELPRLESKEISLRLHKDGTLGVRGLRLPGKSEAEHLRQKLAARMLRCGAATETLTVHQIAESSYGLGAVADRWMRSGASADGLKPEQIAEDYAQLGNGKFGYFEEAFSLPEDVDPSSAQALYGDGVLRVRLPRRPQPPPAAPVSRGQYEKTYADYGYFGSSMLF